ncbi:uncharacterized protein BJ212DRAFT_641619 [Suillus subaureus]|uniref:Secreted protein n=1 Tax=Suillus subaureus TaxID=48587 RepID=A0A9P7E1N4_9AGAM|nr:uncharacterized protein BJ212DRAFT_641619 [Suillus subaureus]KAG1808642.1 hypothetical protein BJ212DRAFT_641619 [Suillus subaureus]
MVLIALRFLVVLFQNPRPGSGTDYNSTTMMKARLLCCGTMNNAHVKPHLFFFILRYVHVFSACWCASCEGQTDPCWPMRVGNHVENLPMTFSMPSSYVTQTVSRLYLVFLH